MKNILLPLLGFVALAACQTYDFEPVKPLAATQNTEEIDVKARPLPPNIMLLLDKSGSMNAFVNIGKTVVGTPHRPGCDDTSLCGTKANNQAKDCDSTCSTRINELRYAMKDFLISSRRDNEEGRSPLGKFGLTLFPTTECGAPTSVSSGFPASDDDAALRATIEQIQTYIFDKLYNSAGNGAPIQGGTPTGNSLKYLLDNASSLGLKDSSRSSFILLLTDGLPNCTKGVTDDCPVGQCIDTDKDTGQCIAKGSASLLDNCLDGNATVRVIEQLYAEGIKTIVIGFGAGMGVGSSFAGDVLNRMAHAGGFAEKHYPAENSTQLVAALEKVSELIDSNPCVFQLPNTSASKPSAPDLLNIYVDDERVAPGPSTYSYDFTQNIITFVEDGNICARLKTSSPAKPVPVRISFLREM